MPMTVQCSVRVSRRAFAEGGVDLDQRRAWFSEEADGLDAQTSNDDSNKHAHVPFDTLPENWQQEMTQLRQENAQLRIAEKKVLEECKHYEELLRSERKKYKALFKKQSAELARLKAYEDRAEQLDKVLQESNKALSESAQSNTLTERA